MQEINLKEPKNENQIKKVKILEKFIFVNAHCTSNHRNLVPTAATSFDALSSSSSILFTSS